MENKVKQQGISLIGFLIVGVIIIFIGFVAIKIAPIYIENYSVKSVLQSLNKDDTGVKTVIGLRKLIDKRLYINDVRRVKIKNVRIYHVKQGYRVDVKYDVTVPMMANLSLIIKFNDHVVVKQIDENNL